MKIIKSYLTKNACYIKNEKISKKKGYFLHSLGVNQENALVLVNSWNRPGVTKAVHGFIQANGTVYETLPHWMRGWHAGGTGNNNYEGYEMTEPSTIKYTSGSNWVETKVGTHTKEHVMGTYNTAVEYFASRCKVDGLDPTAKGVILSHSEAYKLGLASNHGDVEHIWNKLGLTMDQFRKDVKEKMDEKAAEKTAAVTSSGGSFRVKVTCDILNVRQGPGTKYNVVTKIKKNEVYTIVTTIGEWGKLKSGAGFINIKKAYVSKV